MISGQGFSASFRDKNGDHYHLPVVAFVEDDEGTPVGWVVDGAGELRRAFTMAGSVGFIDVGDDLVVATVPAVGWRWREANLDENGEVDVWESAEVEAWVLRANSSVDALIVLEEGPILASQLERPWIGELGVQTQSQFARDGDPWPQLRPARAEIVQRSKLPPEPGD